MNARNSIRAFLIFTSLSAAVQVAGFLLDRAVGDFAFIAASVAAVVFILWLVQNVERRALAALFSLIASSFFLTANSLFAGWVRNDLFQLSEDFGQSELVGATATLVVVLSTACGLLSLLLHRRR